MFPPTKVGEEPKKVTRSICNPFSRPLFNFLMGAVHGFFFIEGGYESTDYSPFSSIVTARAVLRARPDGGLKTIRLI